MIVIALVLLATIFAIGRGKDWFRSYVHYYTILDETYNLTVDAAVKMSKADIGKVREDQPCRRQGPGGDRDTQ